MDLNSGSSINLVVVCYLRRCTRSKKKIPEWCIWQLSFDKCRKVSGTWVQLPL